MINLACICIGICKVNAWFTVFVTVIPAAPKSAFAGLYGREGWNLKFISSIFSSISKLSALPERYRSILESDIITFHDIHMVPNSKVLVPVTTVHETVNIFRWFICSLYRHLTNVNWSMMLSIVPSSFRSLRSSVNLVKKFIIAFPLNRFAYSSSPRMSSSRILRSSLFSNKFLSRLWIDDHTVDLSCLFNAWTASLPLL